MSNQPNFMLLRYNNSLPNNNHLNYLRKGITLQLGMKFESLVASVIQYSILEATFLQDVDLF